MNYKNKYKFISIKAAACFCHRISKMNIIQAYIDRKPVSYLFVYKNYVKKLAYFQGCTMKQNCKFLFNWDSRHVTSTQILEKV